VTAHRDADKFFTRRLDVIHARGKGYLNLRTEPEKARDMVESGMGRPYRDPVVEAQGLVRKVRNSFEGLLDHLKERKEELPLREQLPRGGSSVAGSGRKARALRQTPVHKEVQDWAPQLVGQLSCGWPFRGFVACTRVPIRRRNSFSANGGV
jgi:hypothetical protein